MNRIRRLRRTLAHRASSPGRAEPQARQPKGQEPPLAGRPGRDRVAARFLQHVTAGASVAGQDRPAPTITNSRRRTMPAPRLLPHTVQLALTASKIRTGSGSAVPAARRCAAHGACLAASNWTRAPITRSLSMVRTMREQARRSRAGARLPSSPGAPRPDCRHRVSVVQAGRGPRCPHRGQAAPLGNRGWYRPARRLDRGDGGRARRLLVLTEACCWVPAGGP